MSDEHVPDLSPGAEGLDGVPDAVEGELAGLLVALDAASRRIVTLEPGERPDEQPDQGADHGPDRRPGPDPSSPGRTDGTVTGDSPGSQENRSIHQARARLAQREALALRDELAEVRRRAVAMAHWARSLREAASARRDGEHPAAGDGPRVAALDRAVGALLDPTEREEEDPGRAHDRIAAAARSTIPGVTGAGLLFPDPDDGLRPRPGGDPTVTALDAAALALDDAPPAAAMRTAAPVLVPDIGTDRRWPHLSETAETLGVGAVLWLPLCGPHGQVAAVLTLVAPARDAFDRPTLEIARLFAAPAAVALYGARRAHELHQGLESRDLIGRAKGILIERFGLSDEESFSRLVASSQETNIKLREVAAWLVEETSTGRP